MRSLSAGLCLLFLAMPACGVKTDPVPYLQPVQPTAPDSGAKAPAAPPKEQDPR